MNLEKYFIYNDDRSLLLSTVYDKNNFQYKAKYYTISVKIHGH